MASLLWGKVFFQDHFAGYLREEMTGDFSFTYDESYLKEKFPSLSYTLPLQQEPHISYARLHPFFDNLVAEGWLEKAQTRILGQRKMTRFGLLLAFGRDCIGAVSIIDPEPVKFSLPDPRDVLERAVSMGRASLSGARNCILKNYLKLSIYI